MSITDQDWRKLQGIKNCSLDQGAVIKDKYFIEAARIARAGRFGV